VRGVWWLAWEGAAGRGRLKRKRRGGRAILCAGALLVIQLCSLEIWFFL